MSAMTPDTAREAATALLAIVDAIDAYRSMYPGRPGLDDVSMAEVVVGMAGDDDTALTGADPAAVLAAFLAAGDVLGNDDRWAEAEWYADRDRIDALARERDVTTLPRCGGTGHYYDPSVIGACGECECCAMCCDGHDDDAPTVMVRRVASLTGAPVAECPTCGRKCAYWDDEDTDDDGRLWCDHADA